MRFLPAMRLGLANHWILLILYRPALISALLGLSISSGSWLLLLAVLTVGASYHLQILEEEKLCRAKYGRPYEEYAQRVARYLVFK
jgi:protein-S-isoprenylcysteine O-methyltransferase Ste14